MIKNYIFDFGNVLGEFYPERLTAPYVSDDETINIISDVVFDRLYWDKLDDGSITDDEVRAEIRLRLPKELGDVACLVYDSWVKTVTPVKGMQELISDIHNKGNKIYLLSNISDGFAQGYKTVKWLDELFSMFDGLVMSGTIGMAKPDKRIFEYVLQTFNLDASECLFIDDRSENLESAKVLGISGYLFDGSADALRQYLNL